MGDGADLRTRILELPPKRLALLALQLQEELEAEREGRREPIAVVGMACRFPGGADSPEAFWRLLEEGRDAVVEVPGDRWPVDDLYDPDPDAPGKVATRWGGYLQEGVDRFDAGFFSISPREARAMDPQQRILLETCWRAFEDAGIPPSRYRGERAGVFLGICNNDYLLRLLGEGPEAMDLYLSSGNAYSVAAGRISFTFGFQGPALSVDTACSSSLVALHLAVRSLRSGESSVAVAAGVNVLSSAETTMALSRSHMMAPDGRCKTFDEAADGFVRSEGCGVLLLKRLSDAVRDGDRIHGLIRGTAVNQDGRSTGLTVPNGPAQERVVREALADAGLAPDDIDYVEAHGTGTSLGDPIEIRALGRVFGAARARPLRVGSVKTNLGHLESAAGVAGVVKALLSLREGRIPPHLHLRHPSTRIDWDEYALEVPADGEPWPPTERPRRAGVSSFGFSGTNAHVLLEEAPPAPPRSGSPGEGPVLVPVSGATPEARDAVARALAQAFRGADATTFRDLAHTARVGRAHLPYRGAVVAGAGDEAARGLAGDPEVLRLESPGRCGEAPPVVFLFTGQGAQHPGMGRALHEAEPAFRAALDRCAATLDPLLERPLLEILFEGEGEGAPIYRTALAQPAVVAFEWSLAELWRSWGVEPAAVLGHSLGEFVAATVAGVMEPEAMLRLVAERGRLLESLPGGQRMAAVFAAAAAVEPLLLPGVHVAAFNAPENTVLSGDAATVDRVLERCREEGFEHRVLRLEQAFHSPGVEPILGALRAAGDRVEHRLPRIPLPWNVTGATGGDGARDGGYWARHAREPVRFVQGVRALAELGFRHFLEVGPHPTLSPLVGQALPEAVVVPSLRRGGDPRRDVAEALGRLYVEGVDPDWAALDRGRELRRRTLPVHPFGGERYWVTPRRDGAVPPPRGAVPGRRLSAAVPIFETVFTPATPSFLQEHRFRGIPLVPGPLFAEMARRAAGVEELPADVVEGLEVRVPARVPEGGLRLQTILEPDGGGAAFRILSCPVEAPPEEPWTEHAVGRVQGSGAGVGEGGAGQGVDDSDVVEPPGPWRPVDRGEHLALLRQLGFELGDTAAVWEELEVTEGVAGTGARARLRPASAPGDPVGAALAVDAALQVLGAAVAASEPSVSRMLAGVARLEVRGDPARAARCVARLDAPGGRDRTGTAVLLDDDGEVLAVARGVRLASAAGVGGGAEEWFHALEWHAVGDAPAFPEGAAERVAEGVRSGWGALAGESGLPGYVEWLPALRRWVGGQVASTLAGMGLVPGADARDAEGWAEVLGVVPSRRPAFRRLLVMLEEEGYLRGDGEGLSAVGVGDVAGGAPPPPPGCAPVLALAERGLRELEGVLRGRVDPVHILFPGGEVEPTRAVYRDTPFARALNGAAREAARVLAGERAGGMAREADVEMPRAPRRDPADAPREDAPPLRVLEVGAGSGSTTTAVLEGLAGSPVEYVATDLSPTLVAAAEEASGHLPVTHRVLDVEVDPATQGMEPGSFDLVVAANVLHATRDLDESLGHLAALLRPGGILLLVEGTRPEAWVDVTFGLTDGWWRFRDRWREGHPLLSREGWQEAVAAAGFGQVTTAPGGSGPLATAPGESGEGDHGDVGQLLLVCRLPGAPQGPVVRVDARGGRPLEEVLEEIRGFLDGPAESGPLWILTENAQSVVPGDRPDPGAAATWGVARTFALEHPERWGGVVDLEAGTPTEEAEAQFRRALRDPAEDQVAFRGGIRRVPRLVPSPAPPPARLRLDGGAWLVTGGLGGLGLAVARRLAGAGASTLVLAGRSADPEAWSPDDPRREELAGLRNSGARVLLRSLDVTDADAVREVVAGLREEGEPLRGIVHAAAVFREGEVAGLEAEDLRTVLAPKVEGLRALVEGTADAPPERLVLFSSTTALLGVAGMGAYAAANLHLDAFAHRAAGGDTQVLSVNWGTWDSMRLAGRDDVDRYRRTGLLPMPVEEALDALERAMAAGMARAVVASVDWPRLRSVYEARRRRPLLSRLGIEDRAPAADRDVGGGQGAAAEVRGGDAELGALRALPREQREDRLRGVVEQELRVVLRAGEAPLDLERGFFEMGLDSLMSVELKTRLEKRLATKLPATLTFNHPSVPAVSRYLADRLEPPAGNGAGGGADATGGAGASTGAGSAPGSGDSAAGRGPVPEASPPSPRQVPSPDDSTDRSLDDLSEEELSALLDRRLAGLEGGEAP